LRRPDIGHTEFVRRHEIGTEPIEFNGEAFLGRLQMGESRHHGRDLVIVSGLLPRKAIQEVPDGEDTKLGAPFQELDILQLRAAFAHEFEYPTTEALDPRLHNLYA